MNTNPHDPESVKHQLDWFLNPLYKALDEAIQEVQKLFERKDTPINHPFFASYVRWEIIQRLEVRQIEGVTRKELPNNGVQFEKDGWKVRLLKTSDGQLPGVGKSLARRQYFQQPLFRDWKKGHDLRLIVLWEIDNSGVLQRVYLSCPRGPGSAWASSAHWTTPIPHPAERVKEVFVGEQEDVPFDDEIRVLKDKRDQE